MMHVVLHHITVDWQVAIVQYSRSELHSDNMRHMHPHAHYNYYETVLTQDRQALAEFFES